MNHNLIKYTLLLFLVSNALFSQVNYLGNPSFEDKNNNDKPDGNGANQVEFLQVWKDDIKTINDETCCNGVFIFGECVGVGAFILPPPINLHSPDWYCIGTSAYLQEDIGLGLKPINAQSGSCYVGMGTCELVQQDFQSFFSNDKFVEGNDYVLSMYIRIPATDNTPFHFPTSGSATLKAFVNHDKLNYSLAANNPCNDCTDKSCNKKTGDTNPTEIMSEEVNATKFQPGQWHKISSVFSAPFPLGSVGLLKNDWLTIELNDDGCGLYVLIDDINLAKVCEVGCNTGCSKTDEPFNPIFENQVVTSTTAVKVTNLQNVTSAFMKISTIGGGVADFTKTVSCNNGIEGPIYRDGKDNDGGQFATSATPYILQLFLTNDCGTCVYSIPVIKNSNFTGTATDFQCNACNVATPEPCCCAQPDININNITICGPSPPGGFLYQSVNNITIGPNVTIQGDADVTFYAGNEIIGTQPQDVSVSGAHVISAEIVPCPSCRMGNPDYYDSSNETEGSTQTNALQNFQPDSSLFKNQIEMGIKQFNISIVPNPSFSGIFTVSGFASDVSASIIVYNVLGEIIYKSSTITASLNSDVRTPISIDISSHPKGIYFVKIQNGEAMEVQKIIYQ